ncbi:hypothetical protein BCR43DRAFT_488567 [Syncephalastrum racemosum]|uniref:C2H2-type domain-containing protein n=1 Tax=Syncephalastrum racemosum TaxID=13706 RepID=A0A1X2HIU0_SYNRA|nr:hypothetical protein BCR43DRAFT_488567 [Syncephalastrum racemosum]
MADSSRRLLAEVSSTDGGHHERDNTTDRPSTSANYTCPACRRDFRRESAFLGHFRYCSSDDRPLFHGGRWQCEVCLKRFSFVNQLSKHQSSHHQCDLCKEFPFLTNTRRVKHMKETHPSFLDSYRPFACRVCKRSFADRLSMSIHLHGTHRRHVEQPCPFCKESLKNNNNVREAHFQTNHPLETLSQCYVCSELFTSTQNILKHRQEHHPDFIMA